MANFSSQRITPLNASEKARVVAGAALLAALFIAREAMFDQPDHFLLGFWYPIFGSIFVTVSIFLPSKPKVLLILILTAFTIYAVVLTSIELILQILY